MAEHNFEDYAAEDLRFLIRRYYERQHTSNPLLNAARRMRAEAAEQELWNRFNKGDDRAALILDTLTNWDGVSNAHF